MSFDFSKFDNQINTDQLQKDIAAAAANNQQYEDTPNGTYMTKVEKLEIGKTKDGRPMLKAMFRIIEGEYKKKCLFYNRALFGTKNDGNMIHNAKEFLRSLDSGIDVDFESYSQFADLTLDIFEEIESTLEYEVDYDADAFDPVTIKEVFEA